MNRSRIAQAEGSCLDSFHHLRLVPGVAALREQIVRGDRPPGAGGIKFAIRQRFAFPAFADRIHDLPRGFDFVAADEQRGVADHRFEQQPFVSLGRVSAEFGVVAEMHAHRAHFQAGAGNLAVEAQVNAFVRLQAQRDRVGIEVLAALRGEQDVRRGPKLNAHFARAQRQVFAGAQIKRHAGPAPVVDEQLQRDVSFDVGIGLHLRFLAITGPRFAIDHAGEILAAHHLLGDVLGLRAGEWI